MCVRMCGMNVCVRVHRGHWWRAASLAPTWPLSPSAVPCLLPELGFDQEAGWLRGSLTCWGHMNKGRVPRVEPAAGI